MFPSTSSRPLYTVPKCKYKNESNKTLNVFNISNEYLNIKAYQAFNKNRQKLYSY